MSISNIHGFDEAEKAKIYISLGKLLSSHIFSASSRQQRFLKYLVDQALNSNSENLKGYTIGVDVFDRGTDFDSTLDSIVRVEAGRLRAKLREYYEIEGRNDAIRFDFPKGTYTIEVIFKRFDEKITLKRHDDTHLTKISEQSVKAISNKQLPIVNTPSLAVLPFVNISADPSNDYLTDGITDSLIFELSNFPELQLISRQTSFSYRNKPLRGDEIGLELGVRYLLEGSLQRIENRIRVSAQLSDTLTGRCLWTERYDRQFEDVFNLQDEITHNVVKMLHIKLISPERDTLGHEGTVSLIAYDLLMSGLEEHWKYTPGSLEKAVSCFNLALQHDADYATAHAWLSRSLAFQWIMGWGKGEDILNSAYEHARIAVQHNQYLPYAFSVLGWVHLLRKNGPEAIANCRKGVLLDANSADGLMFLSMSLTSSGNGKEGLHYIEMAMRLAQNPSAFHLYVLGLTHYVLKNYDLAEASWQRGCEMATNFIPNHYCLCLLYALLERDEECVNKREEIHTKNGGRAGPVRSPWLDESLSKTHQALVKKAKLESAHR